MKKYISPSLEVSMFDKEDLIQTSSAAVSLNSIIKSGVEAATVLWSDVVGGNETVGSITE